MKVFTICFYISCRTTVLVLGLMIFFIVLLDIVAFWTQPISSHHLGGEHNSQGYWGAVCQQAYSQQWSKGTVFFLLYRGLIFITISGIWFSWDL